MKSKLKLAGGLVFVILLLTGGNAHATGRWNPDPRLNLASATDRFDMLGYNYQRHLDKDSYSRVSCDPVATKSYECAGLWKVTATSDEDILTHFTFKARGTVIRSGGKTVTSARFVKWETVKGTTRKTSSVMISATEMPQD